MRTGILVVLALLAGCGKCSQQESKPAAAAPAQAPPSTPEPPPASVDPAALDEALRLFDHGDAAGALKQAESVLATDADNVRALRLAASSACLIGDTARARRHVARLPELDRKQIVERCHRHGVEVGP